MLAASGVAAELYVAELPVYRWALDLATRGVVPGGTRRNLDEALASGRVAFADDVTEAERLLCADAQTSGGLLLAVPPERHDALLAALAAEGTPARAAIGRVTEGVAGAIRVARQT
jgi:selenide,water dikinase